MSLIRVLRRAITGAVIATALVMPVAAAEPAPTPDPALKQNVSSGEAQSHGHAEIGKGHVDLGPRKTSEGIKLLARDDSQSPPVWRQPDDLLIRVHDAAQLTLPDDPKYKFLGVPSGQQVYVIPQTENREVVWLGWNTQDPALTQMIDRGASLVFHRVQGPGSFHVFLQNGFDAPTPLWNGSGPAGQEIWVDVNTHTHANWVFSQPGVYLVDFSVRAQDRDGQQHTSRSVLRFAVGDAVSAQEAYAAELPASASDHDATQKSATPSATATSATAGSSSKVPMIAVAVGLVAVAGGVIWGVLRGRRAKRQASVEHDD